MMAQGTRCPRGHRELFYFTVILTTQNWTLQDQLGCLLYGPPEEDILDNPSSLNTHWPECVQIPLPSALYSNSEFSHRETDHSSLSRARESRRRFSVPNPGLSLTNQVNWSFSLSACSFSVCLPHQTPSALDIRTKYNTFLTCTHTAALTKSICRSPTMDSLSCLQDTSVLS